MFKTKKIISSVAALALATCTIFGNGMSIDAQISKLQSVVVPYEQVNADSSYGLVGQKEGNILHAWDWKFSDVTANMKAIAESGYSDVQVSPCQTVSEGVSSNKTWWQFYQPTDFAFGNSLGSASEFQEMCTEAHKYGVHVIVDIVCNHLAGSNSDGTALNNAVADKWKNNASTYFHKYGEVYKAVDESRVKMVLGTIGMPDLNTENVDVQNAQVTYLNQLMDMGADGFRFDAAKHIGTPSDSGEAKSDFWQVIANAVKQKNPDALLYGEILNEMPIPIDYYTPYIKVTESQKGWDMKDLVHGSSLSKKLAFDYTRTTSASNLITWVESHDTYCNANQETGTEGCSNYMSNDNIKLTWALIASRADAQSLFFARPAGVSASGTFGTEGRSISINGSLGINNSDTTWKSKEVAAVNKFHNAMVGKSEKTSVDGNVAYIERGDKGIMIVNMGSGSASINVSTSLADGTYTDQNKGGSFTVSGGKLQGTVAGSSFAAVYDDNQTAGASISASKESGTYSKAFDLTVTVKNAASASYKIDGKEAVAITNNTATISIGKDAKVGDTTTVVVSATSSTGEEVKKTLTYTYKEQADHLIVHFDSTGWTGTPNIYLYTGGTGSKDLAGKWPGTAMTKDSSLGQNWYTFEVEDATEAYVVFNNGSDQYPLEGKDAKISNEVWYGISGEVTPIIVNTPTPNPTTSVPTPTQAVSTPVVSDTPEPSGIQISTSLEDGASFSTETKEITITAKNAQKVTCSVDDGPEVELQQKNANGTISGNVTIGLGKIGNSDVKVEVKADDKTAVYTYHKVKNATLKKQSAVNALNTIFKVIEESQVNAASETGGMYATNPNSQVGKEAKITIDGDFSDWSEDMLIAQGGAWDIANAWKGGHENCVLDCYSLYGAWDDENLYLGWQMVNVTDTWAGKGDGPLSDDGRVLDVPLMLALNVGNREAMTGKMANGKLIWDALQVEFETRVDNILLMSGKVGLGTPGYFIAADASGGASYDADYCLSFKTEGINYKMAKGCLPKTIMGLEGSQSVSDAYDASAYKDMMSKGHNTEYDSFYEINIPLKTLGIDKQYLEQNGIGVMQLATRGVSAIDCIPHDPSMLDNALGDCAVDPSTSHEKDDTDIITVPLAAVGNIKGNGGNSNNITTPKPATPTPTATQEPTQAPTVAPTATPTATPTPTTDPGTYEATVNFGADRSAPQYRETNLTVKAELLGGKEVATYEFTVNGETVQAAGTSNTFAWSGTERASGVYKFGVKIVDKEGNVYTEEKDYIFAAQGEPIPTLTPVTGEPTQTPSGEPTQTPSGEPTQTPSGEPTQTPSGEPTQAPSSEPTQAPSATPTQEPTAKPTQTPSSEPTQEPTASPETKPLSITSISVSKKSPQVLGEKIRLSVKATGGKGAYKYSYVVETSSGNTVLEKNNIKNSYYDWKPTAAGSYVIYVYVQDSTGKIKVKSIGYKIKKLVVNKVSYKSTTKKGQLKVAVTVKATPAKGKAKYKFMIQDSKGKTKTLRNYGTKNSYTWKITKKGKYKLIIKVTDGTKKVVTKTKTFTLKK